MLKMFLRDFWNISIFTLPWFPNLLVNGGRREGGMWIAPFSFNIERRYSVRCFFKTFLFTTIFQSGIKCWTLTLRQNLSINDYRTKWLSDTTTKWYGFLLWRIESKKDVGRKNSVNWILSLLGNMNTQKHRNPFAPFCGSSRGSTRISFKLK